MHFLECNPTYLIKTFKLLNNQMIHIELRYFTVHNKLLIIYILNKYVRLRNKKTKKLIVPHKIEYFTKFGFLTKFNS